MGSSIIFGKSSRQSEIIVGQPNIWKLYALSPLWSSRPRAKGADMFAVRPALHHVPITPGTLTGGCYRILHPLGRGGGGAVYLAEDQRALGRHCVVKELLVYAGYETPAEVEQATARFEAEARVLTQLRHPHTPQIYAYIREAGRLFIAMEYINGPDLEQGLTRLDENGTVIQGNAQQLDQTLLKAV